MPCDIVLFVIGWRNELLLCNLFYSFLIIFMFEAVIVGSI